MARGLGLVICWVAVAWSRCLKALLRWLLMSATFTLVHGSLRTGDVAGQRRRGVPLSAVLNLSKTTCASPHNLERRRTGDRAPLYRAASCSCCAYRD